MHSTQSCEVIVIMVLLCTRSGSCDFGIYLSDNPHITPQLDEQFATEMRRNGLHAEIVGEVADYKSECGNLLMDYTTYVDGTVFEAAIKPMEEELMALRKGTFFNDTLRSTLYQKMKAVALDVHISDMKALFGMHRASVPVLRSMQVRFRTSPNSGGHLVGMGVGQIMKGLENSLGANNHGLVMEKHSKSLLDMLAWASNTITLETYRNRYVQGLESVMQQLHVTLEHTLTQLFSFGRLTQSMMQMSKDRSVMSVIEQLMGEKVFKESLLALHGSTALGAVEATVIGMNDNMIEMEVHSSSLRTVGAYRPEGVRTLFEAVLSLFFEAHMLSDGNPLSNIKYVLHVEPLGQFSWNMDSFWTDNVGQRYAVEKEHKHATLDSLLSVPDVGLCRKMSTIQLCQLQQQPLGCGLEIGNRHGCRRTVYNSTNEIFTLVRPLARSVVIATKTRYMYLASEYAARDLEAIDIKCPTFAVEIPKGKMLMIGGVDVHSRCVQESRDGELRVIVPETQYSPVESLYNEWLGTWTNGLNIAVIWFCLAVIGTAMAIMTTAGIRAILKLKRRVNTITTALEDNALWRQHLDTYRLPASTAPPMEKNSFNKALY